MSGGCNPTQHLVLHSPADAVPRTERSNKHTTDYAQLELDQQHQQRSHNYGSQMAWPKSRSPRARAHMQTINYAPRVTNIIRAGGFFHFQMPAHLLRPVLGVVCQVSASWKLAHGRRVWRRLNCRHLSSMSAAAHGLPSPQSCTGQREYSTRRSRSVQRPGANA